MHFAKRNNNPAFQIRMSTMPKDSVSDHQLLAYLEEMLPGEEMATLEKTMRDSQSLRRQVASLTHRRDQGLHSVGEI